MRNIHTFIPFLSIILLAACGPGEDTSGSGSTIEGTAAPLQVSAANFTRAETDVYMAGLLKKKGIGVLDHQRELTPVNEQTVVRSNRDTYYSMGVFDLDAGPVTITLPDAGDRYMSLLSLDEDHFVAGMDHAPMTRTFTREEVGTRYMACIVRTFGNPGDSADVRQVHALQDAITVAQPGGPGVFELPNWDMEALAHVRDSIKGLAGTMTGFTGAFGTRAEVDPVAHLVGTAVGWGGNPSSEAVYESVTPERNDGRTVHTLHVQDVPVDGFWSVTVYNADGFMEDNAQKAYSLNSVTATKNRDGSIDVQFGGCDGKVPNCLPIMAGWNYTVRMYRPRPVIGNGAWTFPKALAVQ